MYTFTSSKLRQFNRQLLVSTRIKYSVYTRPLFNSYGKVINWLAIA